MPDQSTINNQRSTILRARYVFPVAGQPIRDGEVTICGDRIVAVGRHGRGASRDVCNLGNVAILPGLVNAHVHLNFSQLSKPIGEPGIGFVDWIRRAIEHREQGAEQCSTECPITIGLAESIRAGVTTIGEIAQFGWPMRTIADSPLGITVFLELIAPNRTRTAEQLELARSHLRAAANRSAEERWQPGLSPHAPYSVNAELLAAIVALSANERAPLAMHLAESREELELLQAGTGPLRDLLDERNAWDPMSIQPGSRPMDYLRLLAKAARTLVVHGNYLDDEEISFLGANASHMSVVYCPRSHDWFGHSPYPLEKMLATGAMFALGTDGRGSSPDLSLLAEMRRAAEKHPTVGFDRILQMGTLSGAKALGLEHCTGSIEPGKRADLTMVALPDGDATDPHELLFNSTQPVVGCYCRGLLECGDSSPLSIRRRCTTVETLTPDKKRR